VDECDEGVVLRALVGRIGRGRWFGFGGSRVEAEHCRWTRDGACCGFYCDVIKIDSMLRGRCDIPALLFGCRCSIQ